MFKMAKILDIYHRFLFTEIIDGVGENRSDFDDDGNTGNLKKILEERVYDVIGLHVGAFEDWEEIKSLTDLITRSQDGEKIVLYSGADWDDLAKEVLGYKIFVYKEFSDAQKFLEIYANGEEETWQKEN